MRPRRTFLLCTFLIGIAGAVACGGGSTNSLLPTGPSGTGRAQITGRVTGMTTSSPSSTVALNGLTAGALTSVTTSTMLKVSISGTNITSSVDGNGSFSLDGVAPGTVTLTFTGSGVNASITLTGVNSGDRIDIQVRIDGDKAQVETEQRHHEGDVDNDNDDHDGTQADDDGDKDGTEIHGTVSNLDGTCPSLTFMIGDSHVSTSDATTFHEATCAAIKDGVRIEANGSLNASGTLEATSVEIDD